MLVIFGVGFERELTDGFDLCNKVTSLRCHGHDQHFKFRLSLSIPESKMYTKSSDPLLLDLTN